MAKNTGTIAVALVVGAAAGFALGYGINPKGDDARTNAVAAAPSPTPAPAAAARPAPAAEYYKVPVDDASPSRGPKDAKVTIVAFSEFQCPFCARVNPTLDQIVDAYGKDVRIVFRHRLLPMHANALPAAEAAMAAHEQGKFWEMHDKLFANQRALTRDNFEKWAQEIGLDMNKFRQALDSGKYKDFVEKDSQFAGRIGASGTPTFFINGRKLVGAQPFERFKEAIDAELKRADAELAKGTKRAELYNKLIADGRTSAAPAAQAAAADTAPRYIEIPADAPTKGPADAKVTIVAFSEFQCPFCARVNPTLDQIVDTYGDDVRIVFRHRLLPMHANALPAAEAAMAAHEQGKFWEMHDKLFANQRALTRENFEKWAQEIGLDMNKFRQALDSGKFKARVESDSSYAGSVGASGTPTFFINGKKFVGAQPFDNFKRIIDEELKRADAELAKGTPRNQLYRNLASN